MATLVMSIEGVLTDNPPDSNILTYESTGSGKVLYTLLRDTGRIVLLSTDHSKERVQAWLARERFTRYADVHCYPRDSILSPAEWRAQHIKDLMGIGHHISFYIDSDPKTLGMVMESGVDCLLVACPAVSQGFKEKDQGYSPWYDLVETIEKQNTLRAAKDVGDEEDYG